MNDHFEFNGMGNNTPNANGGIPPLTPHKPTPTIPQMSDLHERQVFTDKAERVVNQVLAFALTVVAVLFVGGLMYKTFVWGH
jgi:hypothetical protein